MKRQELLLFEKGLLHKFGLNVDALQITTYLE
jgi:hypothetical protein